MSDEYDQVALVSCIWVLMAYIQMPCGPMSKRTGRSAGQQRWADRIFMNMMEQAPLFLTSLWSFAIVISADRAASLGKLYLVFRSLYAPIWLVFGGEGGPPMPHLMISTFPQYGINIYFSLSVVIKLVFEKDIDVILGSDVIGFVVCAVMFMICVLTVHTNLIIAFTSFFDEPTKKKDE